MQELKSKKIIKCMLSMKNSGKKVSNFSEESSIKTLKIKLNCSLMNL